MSYIFNCDRNNSEKSLNLFQRIFLPRCTELDEENYEIHIGKHIYHKHVIIEEIDLALRMAQMEWFHIQSMILEENILPYSEIVYSRDVINNTFLAFSDALQLCDCFEQKERYVVSVTKALDIFSNFVVPITKFEDEVLIKISTSMMNDVKCPIFQYFHAYLDIQFHLLTIYHLCGASEEKLENRMFAVMKDLIIIIKKNYRRQSIQNRQAFLCNCLHKFWLILQLFTEKVGSEANWFWKIFNNVLENEEPMFSLWLLKNISSLQSLNSMLVDEGNKSDRITPNYVLLENKLKILLSNAGSDTFLESFQIIAPIVSNLWLKNARIEVFQIIWDVYSKRLNVSNRKPPQKALELNTTIDTILRSHKDCNEDFEMFVGMLITHLKEHPTHWGKVKGRIYSQLGPNKVKDLNEVGVIHVMELFISLASINFAELSKKIISFVDSLPAEKRNTLYVWNMYTVFIIRHVIDGQDLETSATVMLRMLQQAVNDQKLFHLIKEFVENFQYIMTHSTNYQLHQWLLIDNWLSRYFSTCYYPDLIVGLRVLLSTLVKVSNADSWPLWEQTFKDHIYPSLKQIGGSSTPAPDTVGKIAGKLCRLMPNITNDAFNFFSNDLIAPKISCQFLEEVLDHFPNSFILSSSQEAMVLQSWVKICLLNAEFCENLTVKVMKLDCLPGALKSHIVNSRDAIYAFIEYLGSDITRHRHSNSILRLCEACFGQIDKWLGQFLMQPEDEAIVFRIYTCISLAFLHCGPLLYDRNKSASPLTKLVQVLLLPTDFLIGKRSLHIYVLNAVKKTWHHFFEAIVKLNTDTDTFLERTLRDMIVKYVQYFSTFDSPIMKCLENCTTAPVILEKIFNSYCKHPVKESDANVLKILKILSDFLQSTTSVPLTRMIINKCLYGLFEIVIFHSQRNVALGVIKTLTSSPLYPQVKDDFKNAVVAVTEKHLPFNTINYFQLMYILAKFIPADVKSLLGDIKHHISNVERMRGVGFDKNLRMQFEKLESAVDASK